MRGRTLIQGLFLLVLVVACFWGTFVGIVNTWLTNDDYSYGFLIPLMSAYFIWETRRQIASASVWQDFRALPFLVVFLLFSIYGILGSSYSAVRPSIPFILFFLMLFCFGKHVARRMALPIGFLIFMVPIPNVMNRHVGEPLKAVSSKLGASLIRGWGISVHTSGNIIDLGFTQLQVVDACSGLRFIFPLMALGVAYAYFFQKTTWKRIVCVLATLPIAVLINGLRVGITGILSAKWGALAAEGFFHAFEGWLLFMIGFVLLFVFGRILKFLPDWEKRKRSSVPVEETPSKTGKGFTGNTKPFPFGNNNLPAFCISTVLISCVGLLSWSTKALPPVNIEGGIASFPLEIGGWRGISQHIDDEIVVASGAEASFSSLYRNKEGEMVELYLGYRSSPFMENENFFHTPISCFPASGWKVLKRDTYAFKYKSDFPGLKATRLIVEKMGLNYLVLFWFQTNKKATHDKSLNRLDLALHAIRRENTHDVYIRLMTPIGSSNILGAEERLDKFAYQLSEVLNDFLSKNQFVTQT